MKIVYLALGLLLLPGMGYSFMLGTKSMDIVKGGDHKRWQDWGWVSLNINPRILFVKWQVKYILSKQLRSIPQFSFPSSI